MYPVTEMSVQFSHSLVEGMGRHCSSSGTPLGFVPAPALDSGT
jgi:hypothetical protein